MTQTPTEVDAAEPRRRVDRDRPSEPATRRPADDDPDAPRAGASAEPAAAEATRPPDRGRSAASSPTPCARRRPLRLHGPGRVVPRPPRRARRRRHPGRRDAPRGRGGVHGRGPRPADRPAGGLPRRRAPSGPRTWRSASTRPARTRRRCSRSSARSSASTVAARRSRRSTRSRRSAGSPSGPPSPAMPARSRAPWPRPSGRPSAAGPGPVLLSLPEDLLDETGAGRRPGRAGRPRPARPADDDIRAVIELLASAERPVILAGGGVLRARTSTELVALRRAPPGPGHRRVAPGRRHLERPSALPRHGRPRRARVRPRAPRGRRRDARPRLPPERDRPPTTTRIPAAGRAGSHVDIEPGRARRPAPRRACRSPRTPARSCGPPTSGCSARPSSMPSSSPRRQANNAADRAAWEAASVVDAMPTPWDGPGRPSRAASSRRSVGCCPTTRSSRPMPATSRAGPAAGSASASPARSSVPTSGAMGYGLPAAIAASLVHRDRPVVALVGDGGMAMTMAELETAVREHARIIVLVFDNERYGTIRMWQERRGTRRGRRHGARSGRLRGDRAARWAPAGSASSATPTFEPALRQALVEERSTRHPARARPRVGLGRPAREPERRDRLAVASSPAPRTTAGPGHAPRHGRRRGRSTSRSGCSATRSSRRPGAEERGHDLAERPRAGELPVLVVVLDRQPVDVFGRPALRGLGAAEVVVVGRDPAAILVDVEQPLGRMALEEDQAPAGRQQPSRTAAQASRSCSHISEPRPVYSSSAVPSSSCGVSRTSASIQRAGAPAAADQAPRELEHARAEIDADDLVRAQVPQRQRVPAAGALQVDRPPAPSVQVADELQLRRQEIGRRRSEMSATASSNQPS